MKVDNKKKILKISILTTIALAVLLSVSYAFMNLTMQGSRKQVIKAGSFQLTLEEGNSITLANAYPVYDEVGMLSEPFIFTLKNLGKMDLKYDIKLIDTTEETEKIDLINIRYGLKRNNSVVYGNVGLIQDNIIDSGTIAKKTEVVFELRMWIDMNVTENEAISGKTRSFKINVESSKSDDDIILLATLDGNSVSTFPTKEDNYGVESISCTDNLDASFDPETWSVTVDGITKSNTTCTVNFSSSITLDETSEEITMTKSELYAFYKGSFASTATSSEVLEGKTVYINGTETVGTMPNNGSTSGSITTSGGTYAIPAGYTSGGTVTGPTLESLVGNNVTLASNSNLLTGYTAYGTNGVKYTGSMANNGVLNWSPSSSTSYTIPAGYYSGGTLSSENAYNAGYSAAQSASTVTSASGTISLWMEKEGTYTRTVSYGKTFASAPYLGFNTDGTYTITVTSNSTTGFTISIQCNFHDGTTKSFSWGAYL